MTLALDVLSAALAGCYRIEHELGAGGMATVYLAQDLRHDRAVALKVLRPELAAAIGADRFLAEIRTTANLQHPHILPLFDSGRTGGAEAPGAADVLYYVMPYVHGESLRERLTREKQLPISDAVRIAGEVASALDYAHRHGVVHRDIKPENILLHDGQALVADFGIALAASRAGDTRMTETGMSLGTPHYMSPEQAMGEREITPRSDVYALGALTYEMLLGEPPFTGPTAQAIVAKVMTERPAPIRARRDRVPPQVEDAVLTALEKLPADRQASAAEFAAALTAPPTRFTEERGAPAAGDPTGSPRRRRLLAGAGVLGVSALLVAAWAAGRASVPRAPAVFDAALAEGAGLSFAATTARSAYGIPLRNLTVAPDGSFAVYAAKEGDSTRLWYRSLRDDATRPIEGTAGATAPRLSPDGSVVAFLAGERVKVVPVGGGEPKALIEEQGTMFLEWTSPTNLLLSDFDGNRLSRLDPRGGPPQSRAVPRCGFGHWNAAEGRLVCTLTGTASVLDLDTGERWPIRSTLPDGSPGRLVTGTAFRIVEGRYLVFIAGGELRAARYDPERHLAGRSVPLASGVRVEGLGDGQYDITAEGELVYAPGADATIGSIVRLGPGGVPEPLALEPGPYQRFDLSPDRRWLATVVVTADGQELRIHDLRDGQRLDWLRAESFRHPLWSPDGERLLVGVRDSTRWSILLGQPGAGMQPDTVASWEDPAAGFDPYDYPTQGVAVGAENSSFVAVRFDPDARPPRFDTVATGARFPSLSPDGRRLAYGEEAGRVVVTSHPVPGRRWQVTQDGTEPLWLSPNELLYRSGVSWYLARLDPATGEPLGAPTPWGRDPRFSDTGGWSNRPSRDGGIIYVQGPEQVSSTHLRVVPGFVARMKRAVESAE